MWLQMVIYHIKSVKVVLYIFCLTCLASEKVWILGNAADLTNAHLYNADEYKLMQDKSVNFQAYVFVVGSQMKRSVGEFIAEYKWGNYVYPI